MNQKELTKTFMMILNRKSPFGLHGSYELISTCKESKRRLQQVFIQTAHRNNFNNFTIKYILLIWGLIDSF